MTNNNKPSRQEMIDAIYEKIARKDLTFGCRMKISEYGEEYDEICIEESSEHFFIGAYFHSCRKNKIKKIIGHPVMIGDVMDWIEKKTKDKINKAHFSARLDEKSMKITAPLEKEKEIKINILLGSWNELRNPIENQCEHCIRFVYYLISE